MKENNMKHENLEKLKKSAISFLYLNPVPVKEIPFLVHHPFIENSSIALVKEDGKIELIDIFKEPEKYNSYLKNVESRINSAMDFFDILFLMRKPYHLLYFFLNNNNLSEQDYNKALKEIWISTEYPNADKNVSVNKSLQLFKNSNPNLLMDKSEKQFLESLPNEVTIYRGAHTENNYRALSWTLDYDKAKWFANRFNDDGYILKATINKKDIVAFFNARNEDELIVDFNKINNLKIEKVFSIKI